MLCYYLLLRGGAQTNNCFFKALLGQVWYINFFLVRIILAVAEAVRKIPSSRRLFV